MKLKLVTILLFLTVGMFFLVPTTNAVINTCVSLGGGGGGPYGPIRGGRTIGSNQYFQDPADPLIWGSCGFTTWLYDVADQVIYGQTGRGCAEGVYVSNSNQPVGPNSCSQSVYGGVTGPCPNTMYVPDVCGGITGEYTTRAIGEPIFYSEPMNWGNITGDFINPPSDSALIDMTNLTTDFASPTRPPFRTGALAYQADVGKQPWWGKLALNTPVAMDSADGWVFGVVSDTDTIVSQFTPGFAVFPSMETIMVGGLYYKVIGTPGKLHGDPNLHLPVKDENSPFYLHTISPGGASCWTLVGPLLFGNNISNAAIIESEEINVIPNLDAQIDGKFGIHNANLQIAGSCIPSGPVTVSGNYDPDNFLWYTPTQIDQMYAAQTVMIDFEEGSSDTTTAPSPTPSPTPTADPNNCMPAVYNNSSTNVCLAYTAGGSACGNTNWDSCSPAADADENSICTLANALVGHNTCPYPLWYYYGCNFAYGDGNCVDTEMDAISVYATPPCSGSCPDAAPTPTPDPTPTPAGSNGVWSQVIQAQNTSTLNATTPPVITTVGFTDNGVDPTRPFMSLSIDCRNGCTPPGGSICDTNHQSNCPAVANYVSSQTAALTNGDGTSVATALANWGLPSTIQVTVGTIATNPSHYTQYYSGLLTGFISSTHPTAIAMNFNAPGHMVSAELWNQDTGCQVQVSGNTFAVDLAVTTRLFEKFSTTLTITGSNGCSTKKQPQAQVGQLITLNGTGTCYSTDKRELCNQQFTVTGASSAGGLTGNLMGTPQTYTGGTGTYREKPGTTIPALPNTHWTSAGSLVLNSGISTPLATTLANIVGPNQENSMVAASMSGIAGADPGDGLGTLVIGQMGGTAGGFGSIAGF